MPFLGQDWRSPGQNWVKTEDGWKKTTRNENEANNNVPERSVHGKEEDYYKENLLLSINYDVATKKRKKDLMNNNTKIPYFHKDQWIYVHKGSTKERHGYCTLGEAFNRLDFCSAIKDTRRFNYVVRLLELIAKSQLPSLSGVAQKNYMNILERVVQKGEGLNSLAHFRATPASVCLCHALLITFLPTNPGMTLLDLPVSLQLNIMQRLSDGRDLVSLGQVCPDLGALTEDRLLWKNLCQYHFTERQIRRRLIVSDKGHLEWKKMYFKLCRCYPHKEQYSDTLQFCTHCHILFWKDANHPCTANNPESCSISVTPQGFINLFKF
uniref:F-box only protein 32 n=1 Tax=Pygocentrus nattereri TaxID=42514 RepID=A0AAR2L6A6_PYGNA